MSGRGRQIKGFLKSPAFALIAIATVAVPSVVLFRPEGKKLAPTSSPTPAPTTSASASPAKPFGTAIAAVDYTDGRGRVIAMLDANGAVRPCIKGTSLLTVSAVRDGSVIYSDRQAIFEVPLTCIGKPRVVKDVKSVRGRAAEKEEAFGNVMVSPDGTRLVAGMNRCVEGPPCGSLSQEVWFGKRDGSSWHSLDTGAAIIGWADSTHLLAIDGGDPFAIDLADHSHQMFWAPQAYPGSTSPDGTRGAYVLRSLDGGGSLMLQGRLSDPQRPIGLGRVESIDSDLQDAWDPSGTRFISPPDRDGKVIIFDLHGKRVGTAQVGTQELHGWLDDGHLWAERSSVIDIIDVRFGIPSTTVPLPDWGQPTDGDQTTHVHPNYASAVSPPSAKLVMRVGDLDLQTEQGLGVSFRIPPGWRVGDCKDCESPYRSTRALVRSRPALGEESRYPLTFATASDSVNSVINTIERFHHFDPEHPSSSGPDGATLNRSSMIIGGVRFERLDLSFIEGGVTYLVGRVAGRTLIMQPSSDLDDPYMQAVIGSMRFV